MVAGSGSGGVDRIGGSGIHHPIELARVATELGRLGGRDAAVQRDRIMALYCEERVREWTNVRVRAGMRAGRPPGAASSIGKVHQGELNQKIQVLATDILGMHATAWSGGEAARGGHREPDPAAYARSLPYEVKGMLRSRANTIEGGTTEVNKNIIGERVLGLPREPDPWAATPWNQVPRN
jgi:alkylation response protein AidB-like acyl-CoA dehydrogenase